MLKRFAALALSLLFTLAVITAAPPAGKGRYKIATSNDTPAAGQVFTVSGQHFRGRVTLWFGPASGFEACFGTPSKGKGAVVIECSLPQFSPIGGRDLSLGAFGQVFEEVEATLVDGTPTLLSIERGSVLIFVGG